LDFSRLAEEVGFDSVFVSDHFQPWKHTDGHAPNSLAWLGALGASTKRVVIGTSVATPTFRYHPSIVAQASGPLGAMCPGRVERMIEVKVSFDTDAQQAKELTRHWAALALSPEEKTGVEDPVEMERLADALPLDRAASRWIVSSDPDEQVERIRFYVELGFRHLVFHAPGPDQARFLKLYAEQ